MWHCGYCWNAQWFESDSWIQTNVICFIWLQLLSLVINEHVAWLIFTLLLRCSLWGKDGVNCSCFSCKILLVTFWLAEAAQWLAPHNTILPVLDCNATAYKRLTRTGRAAMGVHRELNTIGWGWGRGWEEELLRRGVTARSATLLKKKQQQTNQEMNANRTPPKKKKKKRWQTFCCSTGIPRSCCLLPSSLGSCHLDQSTCTETEKQGKSDRLT